MRGYPRGTIVDRLQCLRTAWSSPWPAPASMVSRVLNAFSVFHLWMPTDEPTMPGRGALSFRTVVARHPSVP
jgi:hypothetical protein